MTDHDRVLAEARAFASALIRAQAPKADVAAALLVAAAEVAEHDATVAAMTGWLRRSADRLDAVALAAAPPEGNA